MSVQDLRKHQPYRFVPVIFNEAQPACVHQVGFHDGTSSGRLTGVIHCTLTTQTPTLVGHFQYPADRASHIKLVEPGELEFDPEYWGEICRDKNNRIGNPKKNQGDFKSVVEPLFYDMTGSAGEASPILIPGTSIKGMLRQVIGALTNAPMERVADNESARVFSVRPQLGSSGGGKRFKEVEALATPKEGEPLKIKWGSTGKPAQAPDEIEAWVVNNFFRTNEKAYVGEPRGDGGVRKYDPLIVEYDSEHKVIVSFGAFKLYRWASADSTREVLPTGSRGPRVRRTEAHSPEDEAVDGRNGRLTGARLFFGYVDGGADDSLALDIGKKDYARLAGRVAVNHACEVIANDESLEQRFVQSVLPNKGRPNFNLQLQILSSPKPSAFWNYVAPGANGELVGEINSWGDLPGYSPSGCPLAGRKFYRRWQADGHSIQTDDEEVRKGNQNHIARFVSLRGRKFRFSVRFHELTDAELGVLLLALSPSAFTGVDLARSSRAEPLWHAIGHGRPLGMGAVTIDTEELMVFDGQEGSMQAKDEAWQKDIVKLGIDTLCHRPSLDLLWKIMQPMKPNPKDHPYYGPPNVHQDVKKAYLAARHGK